MAKKGFALCAACAELTPSAGGYCHLCKSPLVQPEPGQDEGHCPACGALVRLTDPSCYGCGWQLIIPRSVVVAIACAMAALTLLSAAGGIGLYNKLRQRSATQQSSYSR